MRPDCTNDITRATRFQVPQTFLLQQAAWLYERHLDHVRTQMKKVGSTNAPPVSGSGSSQTVVGGYPMQRLGSGGSRGTCVLTSSTSLILTFDSFEDAISLIQSAQG